MRRDRCTLERRSVYYGAEIDETVVYQLRVNFPIYIQVMVCPWSGDFVQETRWVDVGAEIDGCWSGDGLFP